MFDYGQTSSEKFYIMQSRSRKIKRKAYILQPRLVRYGRTVDFFNGLKQIYAGTLKSQFVLSFYRWLVTVCIGLSNSDCG